MKHSHKIMTGLASLMMTAGCATQKVAEEDPMRLLTQICPAPSSVRPKGVQGTVWMKARSREGSGEASGQFPATVQVSYRETQRTLKMEVTNLTGGAEALIEVKDGEYRIEGLGGRIGRGKKIRKADHWSGLPLRWAADLFAGQVPCPSAQQLATARASWDSKADRLVVLSSGEKFIYDLRTWGGKPWVEAVQWESQGEFKSGTGSSAEFRFEEPDLQENYPHKWEAKSAQGELKVRWKTRELRE